MSTTAVLPRPRAAAALLIALFAPVSAAAPPWLQLSVERTLIPLPSAGAHKADFTVTWNCGLFCKEIDYYNIRWGRKGGAEKQSEISWNTEKWSTTLTEPGVVHVFKLQSCVKPDFSIGPFRPGGSSCSKWSEVELLLPAPPANLRAADESDRNAAKFEHRYRLEWQPGAGLSSQELVTSSESQREPTRLEIDRRASETVVTLEPGKSARVRVCGVVPFYTESAKSSGYQVLGCTSFAELRGELPPPRKPKIGPARNLGRQVRVDWEAMDNFTEHYEIERLHWELPNSAVRQTFDAQTNATTQRRDIDLRERKAMPLSKAPARPQPQQTAGSSKFVWVKTSPVSQGYPQQDCKEYLWSGPAPGKHCMRDDPSKYARGSLGAPVTPYQYRVCALNKSGRTCSDFIEVPALYEGVTESAPAVTPPSLGPATTARARPDVPLPSSDKPAIQVSPGMALDGSGRPISPTTQKPTATTGVVRLPSTPQSTAPQQQAITRPSVPSAGKPQDKQATVQNPALVPLPQQQATVNATRSSTGMQMMRQPSATIYRSQPATSAAECRKACQGDAPCKAWTWVKPQAQTKAATGVCRLNSSVHTQAEIADACCVSGVK